LVSLGEPYI